MKGKIFFVVLIVTLLLSMAILGQSPPASTQPCALTLKDAPALRGVKLGMTVLELETALGQKPKIREMETSIEFKIRQLMERRKVKIGEKAYIFSKRYSPAEESLPTIFDGLETFSAHFFNDKIYQIVIRYEKQAELKTGNDLVEVFSEKLKLPPDAWKTYDNDAFLDCAEFNIVATISAGVISFSIENSATTKEIQIKAKKVLEDQDAEAKKAFKP